MSAKTMIVALLALFCGGSAALMVVLISLRSANGSQEQAELVPVVVASTEIGRGIGIEPHMLRVRNWPKENVPEDACKSLEEAVGFSSRFAVVRDEILIKSRLTQGTGLTSLITPGMRAYTIQTSTVSSGVGGFIQPDDRVDVILTVTSAAKGDENRTGGGIATILMQNVQVLAAGRSLQASAEESKLDDRPNNSVTLLVTPRQAQELTLAQTKGTLNLALRREGDAMGDIGDPLYLSDLPFLRHLPNESDVVVEEASPSPAPVEAVVVQQPEPSVSFIRTSRGSSLDIIPIVKPQPQP